MTGLVIIAVLGGFIAFGSFVSGAGIYANSTSSIHQIYAALLTLTSVLGLLTMTVGIGGAVITHAVRQSERQAASDARKMAEALRAVAEWGRTAPSGRQGNQI